MISSISADEMGQRMRAIAGANRQFAVVAVALDVVNFRALRQHRDDLIDGAFHFELDAIGTLDARLQSLRRIERDDDAVIDNRDSIA